MRDIRNEFVPYELALRLKALGFDEPCFATYLKSEFLGYPEVTLCLYSKENIELGHTKNSYRWISLPECCSAPTFSQAFLFVMQFPQIKKYRYNIALYSDGTYSLKDGKDSIYEYLSAEDCLDKLLEIVERKNI